MTNGKENVSTALQFFRYAFSLQTYGESMGRAAEQAAADFPNLSAEEQRLACDWLLENLTQISDKNMHILSESHFYIIEKTQDQRFIPVLKHYYRNLKKWCRQQKNQALHHTTFARCKNTLKKLKTSHFTKHI